MKKKNVYGLFLACAALLFTACGGGGGGGGGAPVASGNDAGSSVTGSGAGGSGGSSGAAGGAIGFPSTLSGGLQRIDGATVAGSNKFSYPKPDIEGELDSSWTSAFTEGRTVTIESFYICDHEVTQKEYQDIMDNNPARDYTEDRKPSINYVEGPDYPVYNVGWCDAIVYCNKRSKAEDLQPCYRINGETDPATWPDMPTTSEGPNFTAWNTVECIFTANGYRLPTEVEWEYAARGGDPMSEYTYAGCNIEELEDFAWCGGIGSGGVKEVKTKKQNALGLYDMTGNVCEWCWDKFAPITAATPVTGPKEGGGRIVRGGFFGIDKDHAAVSYRSGGFHLYGRAYYIGFRVVRSVP